LKNDEVIGFLTKKRKTLGGLLSLPHPVMLVTVFIIFIIIHLEV